MKRTKFQLKQNSPDKKLISSNFNLSTFEKHVHDVEFFRE